MGQKVSEERSVDDLVMDSLVVGWFVPNNNKLTAMAFPNNLVLVTISASF